MQDYYKILDISRIATNEEIKHAYRIKAKLYHPDVNKNENAKQLFQLINEAYRVLINTEKRRWYDFKLNYPSSTTYKTNWQNRSNKYRTYDKSYKQPMKEQQEEKYVKTILDNILFYFMVVSGIIVLIFGIIDLFFKKWEGSSNLNGLSFGVCFLFLLFYGWNMLNKK